jgi:hypothetical protein
MTMQVINVGYYLIFDSKNQCCYPTKTVGASFETHCGMGPPELGVQKGYRESCVVSKIDVKFLLPKV